MAYATYQDVEARYGEPLSASQITQVNVWLADVERRLRRRIRDLDDRVALSEDYKADVIAVESDAVIRILKNPDGFRSEAEGSYSYATDVRAASGFLMILEDEWKLLGVSSAFTITPKIGTARGREGSYRGYPGEHDPDIAYGNWIWDQYSW